MAATAYLALLIPLLLHVVCPAEGQAEYHRDYGKLIGSFTGTSHDVAGTVYAVDENTIRIIGFTYDGAAPDAFLWAGESGPPSASGFIIPKEMGSMEKLGAYSGEEIEVNLPSGKTVQSLAYISVWCRQFSALFGSVSVPSSFEPPAEHNLGSLGFSPRVHNTYASAVVIVNAKQIRLENLVYDGLGPRAYFWVGPGNTPNNNGDYAIPDETGSNQVIREYNGETITLTLPEGTTVFDIGHIGLWCIAFTQDFGHVDIPGESQLNIPPGPLASSMLGFPNCETLIDDELQVSWLIDGADIVIQLRSITQEGMYTAFGISGSETTTEMIGGDVVAAFIDDNDQAQVVDYYLEGQSQCTPQSQSGACEDTVFGATDDVTLVESYVRNGVTTIVYRRPLSATNAVYDKPIETSGTTSVIWARGSINADGRVAYHNTQRASPGSALTIDFGRASSTCPGLNQGATVDSGVDGWIIPGIEELDDATFTVEMGLSGGPKGYDAITGRVGWGIAWFINGFLIPEITVRRNRTYTFLVSGGNDSAISGNYHPFYITDSEKGGYAQLTPAEQREETIYAEPVEGPLCQWMNTPSTGDSGSYDTFESYKQTLERNCEPGDPGRLTWTVGLDAPDELYYQCYTHRFLGWKIRVSNSAPTLSVSIPCIFIVYLLSLLF